MNSKIANNPNQIEFNAALNSIERPVFIVGTMRSGTSYLGTQLDHSKQLIGCPFELRKIWTAKGIPMASDVCGYDCPNMIESDYKRVDIDGLKFAFAKEVVRNSNGRLSNSRSRFLNKCPHLCNKIRLVQCLFPQFQFIWTYRHITDVVISLKNLFLRSELSSTFHFWPLADEDSSKARCFGVISELDDHGMENERIFPGGNILFLAQYWLETCLYLKNQLLRLSVDQYQVVDHNYIICEPEKVSDYLEAFLELPKGELYRIKQTVNPANTCQWKHALTDQEEQIMSDYIFENSRSINEIEEFITSRNS